MKRVLPLLLLLPFFALGQDMNNEKLEEIYTAVSDSINGSVGAWQFYLKEIPIISITDKKHNRMRIMSPIRDANLLADDMIKAALVANFHTALDVKYAVSDGILWSVFTHPLKELSQHQVEDAVSQVYYANINFGTSFTSTSLSFPSSIQKENQKEKFKELELRKS